MIQIYELSKKKIITVLGARPQFIKAAAVSGELRKYFTEKIIHTGQHYDPMMSAVFFEELSIPTPDFHFVVESVTDNSIVESMRSKIEEVLKKEQPDFVLVYGDTNSTLAGARAASGLNIPVIHIEAGLRSYNDQMPEEYNRVQTDQVSTLLFVPTNTAVENLKKEGIAKNVFVSGDVMFDAVLHFLELAKEKSTILQKLKIEKENFCLCTIHRAENTNDPKRLKNILQGLSDSGLQIVLPLHPRTVKYIQEYKLEFGKNITVIEPVGYLDMLLLEKNASKIITDSGGVQKEAYFFNRPCITMRDETEWVETVQTGWNKLVGSDPEKISEAILNFNPKGRTELLFGDGKSAQKIAEQILNYSRQ